MSRRVTIVLELGAHLLCLAPLIWLVRFCTSARVLLNADPVKFIIRFTGDWALYLIVVSLLLLLLGRVAKKSFGLIRLCRLTGLYAFFYATLHLLIYVLIYSGYDFIAASAGFYTGHPGVLLTEWNEVFPGIIDDFRKRRFLVAGLCAWALLLAWSVLCRVRVQHVLNGRRRRHLYRFVYLAAIAALIHSWFAVVTASP